MLDRFTQKLEHDAGMFNRYSHCALKPSSRLLRALQCSIALGIPGDGVITSYPFPPANNKIILQISRHTAKNHSIFIQLTRHIPQKKSPFTALLDLNGYDLLLFLYGVVVVVRNSYK
jgi:hypothetical protein